MSAKKHHKDEPLILSQTQVDSYPFLHWSRGLLVVAIATLFGIVVVLGGLYVSFNFLPHTASEQTSITPKIADPTANWKTYTNSQYSYSFTYPNMLYEVPTNYAGQNAMLVTKTPYPTGTFGENELTKLGYSIGVVVNSANGENLATLASDFDKFRNRKDYTRTEININNTNGYAVTDFALDFPTDGVVLLKNNYEYLILIKYYSTNPNTKMEGKKLFDQILSTFKFANQNSITSLPPLPSQTNATTQTKTVVIPTPTKSATNSNASNSSSGSSNNSPTSPPSGPPVLEQMTGPENGSTVTFNTFCFPAHWSNSFYQERKEFDSSSWSDWSGDATNCYNNVSNGQHTFSVQAKDASGNVSSVTTRTFTVQADTPTNTPTPTATPTP